MYQVKALNDTTTEYAFSREIDAHNKRREFIAKGYTVSLIAYDPDRNKYVFDVTVSSQ